MDIDDVGPDRLDLLEGEAQPRDRVRAYIVDEDVALSDQLADRRFPLIGLHVPDHRALAPIDRHVAGAHAAVIGRAPDIPEGVAALGLELDDVGAHVGKGLGTIGAKDDRRHVGNTNVGQERCGGHGRLLLAPIQQGRAPS